MASCLQPLQLNVHTVFVCARLYVHSPAKPVNTLYMFIQGIQLMSLGFGLISLALGAKREGAK